MDLFCHLEPALVEVAKFCWRCENDPSFGKRDGDNVLILWGGCHKERRKCRSLCFALQDKLLLPDWFSINQLRREACRYRASEGEGIVMNCTSPPSFLDKEENLEDLDRRDPVHRVYFPHFIVGCGAPKSWLRRKLRHLYDQIYLPREETLVSLLCFDLYHRWSEAQVAASGLFPEMVHRIHSIRFHANSAPKQ